MADIFNKTSICKAFCVRQKITALVLVFCFVSFLREKGVKTVSEEKKKLCSDKEVRVDLRGCRLQTSVLRMGLGGMSLHFLPLLENKTKTDKYISPTKNLQY